MRRHFSPLGRNIAYTRHRDERESVATYHSHPAWVVIGDRLLPRQMQQMAVAAQR
jgi:hypothetical protein